MNRIDTKYCRIWYRNDDKKLYECGDSALDVVEGLMDASELLRELGSLWLTVQTYLLQLMGSIIYIYIRISH